MPYPIRYWTTNKPISPAQAKRWAQVITQKQKPTTTTLRSCTCATCDECENTTADPAFLGTLFDRIGGVVRKNTEILGGGSDVHKPC